MNMQKIIYIYDALCPWCYAFTPIVRRLYDHYKHQYVFQIISGGLVRQNDLGHPKTLKETVSRKVYKHIANRTGTSFGEPYFKLAEQENIPLDSEIPAAALAVFRETDTPYAPIQFVSEMMDHIYQKGYHPCTETIYRTLAGIFHFDEEHFIRRMNEDHYRQLARYDFALAKQLQAEAFPRLYFQTSESYFHLISKGYSDYDTIVQIIDRIQNSRGNRQSNR